MRELGAANRMFLSLLRKRLMQTDGTAAPFGLDPCCGTVLLGLDADAMQHVAGFPFALFSLDFQDRAVWYGLLEQRVSEPELASWSAGEADVNQFLFMVLAAIRYLSCREPYAASMLYGMSPDLSRRMATADLAMLPALASDSRTRLSVTLVESPTFWRDLLLLCQDRVSRAEAAVRALGLQLTMQRALGLVDCRVDGGRLIRSG